MFRFPPRSALGVSLLAVFAASGNAAILSFTDRTSFNAAAAPNVLPVETFAGAIFPSGTFTTCAGTEMDSNTSGSGCLTGLGALLPGIQYAVASWWGFEAPNTCCGNSVFLFVGSDIRITLSTPANAIGLDVVGSHSRGIAQLSVFDPIGGLLTSYNFDISSPTFFGAINPNGLIGSVTVGSDRTTPAISNVAFGVAAPEPAGSYLCAVGLAALAVVRRRIAGSARR